MYKYRHMHLNIHLDFEIFSFNVSLLAIDLRYIGHFIWI